MGNKKQQGIYAIPNKVKSLFNKFISWVLHIYPNVGGQFKKRQKQAYDEIMGRIDKFKKGDTAEYLAQVFLSSIAFSNPVYRQEDYGIDFTCSLIDVINKNGKRGEYKELYPNESFNVQVKTSESYSVTYKNKDKNLQWMFNSKTPIILAHMDFDDKKMFFYSISPIHYITIRGRKNYDTLTLNYYKNPKGVYRTRPNTFNYNDTNENITIQLGKPFMTLCITELTDFDILEEKKKILKKVLSKEQENITYRTLKLPIMRWLWKYETNDINTFRFGWNHVCDKGDETINIPENVLVHTSQFLMSLAKSYELHKDNKNYGDLYIELHNSLRKVIQTIPFGEKITVEDIEYDTKSYLTTLGFFDGNGQKLDNITRDNMEE